jgi:hypothetical protein
VDKGSDCPVVSGNAHGYLVSRARGLRMLHRTVPAPYTMGLRKGALRGNVTESSSSRHGDIATCHCKGLTSPSSPTAYAMLQSSMTLFCCFVDEVGLKPGEQQRDSHHPTTSTVDGASGESGYLIVLGSVGRT